MIDLSKTLRWYDPFGGWGNHEIFYQSKYFDDKVAYDTGFCNRLFHWEVAFHIVNQPEYEDYKILLQKKIWPEWELLSFPDTLFIDYFSKYHGYQSEFEYNQLHFKTVYDIENQKVYLADRIDSKLLKDIINKKVKLKSNHYYSDFGFTPLSDFSKLKDVNYIQHIKIKNTHIHEELRDKYKDYIGIHIRRGNGVTYTEEDILTLPKDLQDKYRTFRETKATVQNPLYKFYPDSVYFDLIEKIHHKHPNQKFYISHDLDDEYIGHYYSKFGTIIETKFDHRFHFEHFYGNEGLDILNLRNYSNSIDNVFDLFSLAFCGIVIGLPHSTWSLFAKNYQYKEYADISDNLDYVLKQYQNVINSKKSVI